MNQFLQVEVRHVPRSENDKTDALAKLAASLTPPDERKIQTKIVDHYFLASTLDCFDETKEINVVLVSEVEEETDWRELLIKYIQFDFLSTDLEKRACVKRRALNFTFKNDILY